MLEPSRRLRTRRFGSVARTTKWGQYLTRREQAVLERATSSWSAAVTGSTWFWHEARRALRPGGALVFTHWNRLSWRGLAYRAMHRLHKPPEQGCRGSNPSSTPARATRPFVAYSVPTGFGSSTRRASAGFRSAARATHARSLLAHGSRARSGYATSFARAPSSSASPASNR